MLAPNDGTVGPGTLKIVLDAAKLMSRPFRINYESLLSGNQQSNNRIAVQIAKTIANNNPMPVVELQARIPSTLPPMGWNGISAKVGGDFGNLWQGETNHALEYRLVMESDNADAVTVVIQAG